MKVSTILSLLACVLTVFGVQAQTNSIYVEYNPACMDRYEYRYNNGGHAHIAYHIRLNDREKVILEVGIENKLVHPVRPKDLQSCSDIAINERLVRSINDGQTLVYVVRKENNGFNVSPVGIAAYSQISPTFIGVSAIDHKFVYNFSQKASDQNIATGTSAAKVTFKGAEGYGCPKKLRFEKVKERAGRNFAAFVMIPEIGIIEEKTGFNQVDADNNKLTLNSINGIPLQSYINQFCTKRAYTNVNSGTFYNTGQYTGTGTAGTTTPGTNVWDLEKDLPGTTTSGTTPTGTTGTPGSTPSTGTTFPSTGMGACPVYKDLDRNLYIDRNSGQPANLECGGNTYRNGLLVSDGSVTTTTPTGSAGTTETGGTTTTTTTTTPTASNPCGIIAGEGTHVVLRGETLYGISRRYGISVNRIKSLNGLSGDMISPCMELRVSETRTASTGMGSTTTDVSKTHVVKRGETLYAIATRYGYTVARMRKMNNLSKTDMIYVGQRLIVDDCNCPDPNLAPSAIPTSAEFIPAEELIPREYDEVATTRAISGKRRVHIVKDNETIYSIAKLYNMEASQVRRLNNLEENEIIIPFQRLYIE